MIDVYNVFAQINSLDESQTSLHDSGIPKKLPSSGDEHH